MIIINMFEILTTELAERMLELGTQGYKFMYEDDGQYLVVSKHELSSEKVEDLLVEFKGED